MARRGHRVTAVDNSLEMLFLTAEHARADGVGSFVSLSLNDVHALGCRTGAAALVTALGVVPWLHSPAAAVKELARVVQPGGYLLLTSDNSLRLVHLVDPRYNPLVMPVLRALKRVGVALGLVARAEGDVGERRYRPGKLDKLLAGAGLRKVRECSIGFGRFTFLGRPFLPERWGQALNRRLQRLADRDVALFRHLGNHTMVLARRPF